ncbi:T9SS type A sorting domain-containing protein [candidate division KSB1 bacterium]|nr:T9SS type A sorting domain-containing protein [candidate division KSB1 bacterium]
MRYRILTMTLWIMVVLASSVFSAGTPHWWDNPFSYAEWSVTTTTGTVYNEGPQAQLLTARVDVPNICAAHAEKIVWMQVEWSVAYGSGSLMTGANDVLIMWENSQASCPTHPMAPFPDPPDGSGYMTYMSSMDPPGPEWGFTFGDEFSFGPIMTRPACERIELQFWTDNTSRIDYRIEIQTLCADQDLGDAPDPLDAVPGNYPTLRANDGARHIIIPQYLYMGTLLDGEADGHPSPLADGDNNIDSNDEDGVNPNELNLVEGQSPVVDVAVVNQTTRDATLIGWIDYNGNGVWENVTERANAVIVPPGNAGAFSLFFPVIPAGSVPMTYARFRLSTVADGIMNPTGLAVDGEVEDYQAAIQALDFGDAPDPLNIVPGYYPTLLANNGARHIINPDIYMGAAIDAEPDGNPAVLADGDDLLTTDDEDGVANPAQLNLTEGLTPAVDILVVNNTPTQATLVGWIDYNGDGVFDSMTEKSNPVIATPGIVTLLFPPVPMGSASQTYARFRLSTDVISINEPAGLAQDGEVEDWLVTIQGLDFGDAPDQYPTTEAQNGARHVPVDGLYMGTAIDTEPDGVPSLLADSDDLTTMDDEDGVDPAQLTVTIGTTPAIDVDVTNSTGSDACLIGWFDYNQDGIWDNMTERATIVTVPSGTAGPVTLSFPEVPISALPPGIDSVSTYVRFRLSNDCNSINDPTGYSRSGEVEDYMGAILVPVELSSFSAVAADGGILIEWTTQSETENLGFHLLRSENRDGRYTQITTALIKGAGSSESEHSYYYRDQNIIAGNTYYYKLADVDFNGTVTMHGPVSVVASAPKNFVLEQNYPNPFNPSTTISFSLKIDGPVKLLIYNMNGQLVRSLVNENKKAGIYTINWDGVDDNGNKVPSGVYIYALKAKDFTKARKMTYMK